MSSEQAITIASAAPLELAFDVVVMPVSDVDAACGRAGA